MQAFTQDDAHHFCTPEQVEGEIMMLIRLLHRGLRGFGSTTCGWSFPPGPEKSIGSDAMWQKAETALKNALEAKGVDYVVNPGDGAFYGPKIDFHIRDALKRSWQCGTIQVYFSMPERFELKYVGADGERTPR